MPIFEYACKACNHTFEKLVWNGDTQIACPKCQNEEVRKLLSVFSFSGSSSEPAELGDGGCGRCGAESPGQCRLQ